jgi:DNA-binding MarR family transcriptional regulator
MTNGDANRLPQALTQLALAVFRANGALLARGDVLVERAGLTSARWQVLGALALAGRKLTVPEIARSMGLTRQGIQKRVNLLIGDGPVSTRANPTHQRSQLVELTVAGRAAYARRTAMGDRSGAACQRPLVGGVEERGAGAR